MIEYLIQLEDYPDYFITETGDVYSGKRDKIIKFKPCINSKGYFQIDFWKDGKRYSKSIHRLLAETFINNPENKPFIDHIDRNKLNNNLENLRWSTHSENNRNGTKNKNNTSGILGVSYDKKFNRWRSCFYNNEGKLRTKSFSQNKYQNAKQLAIEYRKEMERLYYPTLTIL